MNGGASLTAAKHSSLFAMENDKEMEKIFDELGIIGTITYGDDSSEPEDTTEGFVLRTPKVKRPTHDVIIKCRTPEKPKRSWRFNRDPAAAYTGEKKFKCSYRRSPHSRNGSGSDLSIVSLPYEIVLHTFKFLDLSSLARCLKVCKSWNSIASDLGLWKRLNLSQRTLNIVDLQGFLRNTAGVICLNSATVHNNDRRRLSWMLNKLPHHTNNNTPMYTSICEEEGSPMRDPFSRVYHYQVQSLDFTNADINPATLCLILTRCNELVNLSLENLTINHHVLGCVSNCHSLSRLNLTLCKDVTVYGLVEILLACNQMTELNLAWSSVCKYPPDEIVSHLPLSLTRLNIGGFRDTLQDGHVAEIISRCKRLQDLDLSDSNHLTSTAVDMIVRGLSDTLEGINLSRCYSVTPDSLLRFVNMPCLHYLDVFGVMDDVSVAALADALPRVNVSLRPFSAIARPAPTMSLQKPAPSSTIWGQYVKK